jgi:hypothetical protein
VDPFDSDEWRRYAQHAVETLVPMLEDSVATVSLMPTNGEPDIKFALELGMSIMLEKPIIALVTPGGHVPRALALIADEIIEADLSKPEQVQRQLTAALARLGLSHD